MKIALYVKTLKTGFLSASNYRTEVWFNVLMKMLIFGGILLFWSVVGASRTNMGYAEMLSYFLIANGVRELIDGLFGKFSSFMIDEIKTGKISSYLLMPVHVVIFLYSKFSGMRGVSLFFALLFIIVGMWIFPPGTWFGGVLFAMVVFSGLVICFSISSLIASLAFWITEAKGIKNTMNHVSKVFSGALIPVSFFPAEYRVWVVFSPFASYAHLPATLLQSKVIDEKLLVQVAVSYFWALGLLGLSRLVWRKGVAQYEAIGI